jgi:protein arginine kinase activator
MDRPVECSQCKKNIKFTYKEIVRGQVQCFEMCADCPILEAKLHGQKAAEITAETSTIFCGECHTSLEAVKMGNPVGCAECYEVFGDLILDELLAREKIPERMKQAIKERKVEGVHVKEKGIVPINQLVELNEALNEALRKENYEQAAILRDQIKQLKEKPKES